MEDRLDLAIVESRGWDNSSDSVRGVFDVLAGMLGENPLVYRYEMFNSAGALREIVHRLARQQNVHNIYLASHGAGPGRSIRAAEGNISRAVVRDILQKARPQGLYGLFIGCCGLGLQTQQVMGKLGLTWMAGYTEPVDWVHTAALDLYFWNAFFHSGVPESSTKQARAAAMFDLLMALRMRVPTLFTELGFRATLAWQRNQAKRAFLTFPEDFVDEIEDASPELRLQMEEQPGAWRFNAIQDA